MSVNRKILLWLETELFEGRVELGQNLPNDRKIASIVGASHSSTREALKQLEIMGILRLYEGKRKTIIARLVSEPFTSATPALRLHMASSRHPVRDIVQTRTVLESWAVAHADTSHPAMEELEAILRSMQREGILPQEFHQYEVNFHIALTKLAGNQLITGLMTSLRESIYEYLLSIMGRVPLWSSTAIRLRTEHRAILDALRNGDTETASQLVVSTIRNQYSEADIDLDEATEVANEMPGSRPSLTPVEVENDDYVPEEWEEAVSPQLIEALESIGTPWGQNLAPESEDSTSDETAPTEQEKGVDQPKSSLPAPTQAVPQKKEPPVAQTPPAPTVQKSGNSSTLPQAWSAPEPPLSEKEEKTQGSLSRNQPARRYRGVVSSPVRARTLNQKTSRELRQEEKERAEQERLERISALTADESALTQAAQDTSIENAVEQVEEEQVSPETESSSSRSRRLRKWLGFTKEPDVKASFPDSAKSAKKVEPEKPVQENAQAEDASQGEESTHEKDSASNAIDEKSSTNPQEQPKKNFKGGNAIVKK